MSDPLTRLHPLHGESLEKLQGPGDWSTHQHHRRLVSMLLMCNVLSLVSFALHSVPCILCPVFCVLYSVSSFLFYVPYMCPGGSVSRGSCRGAAPTSWSRESTIHSHAPPSHPPSTSPSSTPSPPGSPPPSPLQYPPPSHMPYPPPSPSGTSSSTSGG